MKLTDKAIKNAKAEAKPYKLFDGGGLYLEIMPAGSKLWRLKYRYLGTEKRISLGHYPIVTLAEARDRREEAKKLLSRDIDPSDARQDGRREIIRNAANTFEAVAREWHETQKGKWSEKHAANVMRRLEMDLFPHIGHRPMLSLDAPEILAALRKIEARGALDIAARVRSIAGQIFRHAVQNGKCPAHHNPIPHLAGALRTRKTQHFAAIEGKEIPLLLHALERNDQRLFGTTRRAIMFQMLTFVRPGEAREAKWDEFDFDEAIWRIPAERMKMRRPHLVPLSRQTLNLLKEQRQDVNEKCPWVFPGNSGWRKPMSNGTVLVALKRMGFSGKMTAHGFRALARSTIREELDYEPDVIEAQLAHKAAGPLGEAYNRAQHLTKRKRMMQDWSDYIDRMASGGKVIRGKFGIG